MSELIEDIKEDIKREDLLIIWQKYSRWIMGGVLTFVLGASGFLYWQHHKETATIQTSIAYAKIMEALDPKSPEATVKALQELAEKSAAGYKILSGLTGAGLSSDPAQDLKQMSKDPKIEKAFQEMAQILGALADLDEANPRSVLDMLASFENSASPFRPLAREIMGYAMLRLGNSDTALNLFESLIHDQMAPQSIRGRSQAMVEYIRGNQR